MKVAVAVAVLAGFSGFVLGRMTSTNKDFGERPLSTTTATAMAMTAGAGATATTDDFDDVGSGAAKPVPVWAGGPTTASTATVVSEERVQFLEGEVKRLKKLVDAQTATQTESEGTPLAFPEGHSKEADQQKLLAALQTALKAHGLEGDVAAVDCSEFPCIAHGGFKGIDDDAINAVFDEAKAAVGGAPYASLNRFKDAKDAANDKTTFSISLYPENLPQAEQDNLNKRLRARKNAYVDAAAHD